MCFFLYLFPFAFLLYNPLPIAKSAIAIDRYSQEEQILIYKQLQIL